MDLLLDLRYFICLYIGYFVWFSFLLAILSSPLLFIKKEWKFKIIPIVFLILALFGFLSQSAICMIIDFY